MILVVDVDVVDQAEVDDIQADLGVVDILQRAAHHIFGDHELPPEERIGCECMIPQPRGVCYLVSRRIALLLDMLYFLLVRMCTCWRIYECTNDTPITSRFDRVRS